MHGCCNVELHLPSCSHGIDHKGFPVFACELGAPYPTEHRRIDPRIA